MGVDKIIEVPLVLEIPVGPQHPALHEPLLLKVYVEGEEIVNAEVITGYNHRGIEKLCEKKSFYQNIFLVGRVCGICNTVHADCYVRAIEEILGIEPSDRARFLRTLAQELERIHSHMLINAVIAELIGYDTLFMLIMRDRELVMKAKEILTGARVLADYIMVGGVRRDIDETKKSKILDLLEKIRSRVKYYIKVFEDDVTINKRLVDVGVIKPRDIVLHSLLGPVARGSGIEIDVRKSDKYDAYDEVPFNIVVRKEMDSWARMMVRWEEVLVSIEISRYILEHLPQDSRAVPDERRLPRRFPPGEAFTRVEAPRGELTYYVKSDGRPNPYRVKIRTPSFNNIINSRFVYLNHSIADLPVILASLDPCISCMERATIIDLKNDERKIIPLKKLSLIR